MKTILAATDFSDNATTAVHYAAELAKHFNAKLLLLSAYHFPNVMMNAPLPPEYYDTIMTSNETQLRKLGDEIQLQYGDSLHVECESHMGFAVDEIINVSAGRHADLVVMGTKGTSGLELVLMGSVASEVIRKSTVPVMVIPPKTVFHPLKSIVFACNKAELAGPKAHDILAEFVKVFGSKVELIDVVLEKEEVAMAAQEINSMKSKLEDVTPAVHILENEKVVNGIKDFVEEQHADLIVMVPQQHSFFERLFTEIHTRKMAVSTSVPMLTIPYKD
jgi:nucleotide-binding universal stress UspA family protein